MRLNGMLCETKLKIALLMTVLVSGCVTTGPAEVCAGWKPILLDTQSINGLTERDAQSILAHNEFGQEIRCW